jgi:hypothetical protein
LSGAAVVVDQTSRVVAVQAVIERVVAFWLRQVRRTQLRSVAAVLAVVVDP